MSEPTAVRPEHAGAHPIRFELLRSVDAVTAVVLAAAAAGIGLRAAIYASGLMGFDADEAVWGLMARHVLHGQLTFFFWGQSNGGSQEVLLTAPVFAVFGSSPFAMRIVPILLNAVAAVLVWRIGRRTVGEPAARVAAAIFWVWPYYGLWKLEHAHGFYGSGLVYACLVLLLALRLAEAPTRRDVALLGLVLGLGLWQTLQIVPIVAASLAWLTWKQPRVWLRAWAALPGLVFAIVPYLVSNLRNHWWVFPKNADSTYVERLRVFFDGALPSELGFRTPFMASWVGSRTVAGALYVLLLVAFAYFAVRSPKTRSSLLFVVAATFPFVAALSPVTVLSSEPRYVEILAPVLALLLALPFDRPRWAAVGVAIPLLVSAGTFARALHWQSSQKPLATDIPLDLKPLIADLERRGIDRVFADYWIAFRLDFDSRERIVASSAEVPLIAVRGGRVLPPASNGVENRYPAYFRKVMSAPRYAYVVLRATDPARRRRLLLRHGFSRSTSGAFAIYLSPKGPQTAALR